MGKTKHNFSNKTVGAEVLKDEWELEAREVTPTNSQPQAHGSHVEKPKGPPPGLSRKPTYPGESDLQNIWSWPLKPKVES